MQRNRYQFYTISLSHPPWVRGLKCFKRKKSINRHGVASLADAWIKINTADQNVLLLIAASLVDERGIESHSIWMHGLKL